MGIRLTTKTDKLSMIKYLKELLKQKDQRIAELEQDLEFTTKTANELIEIKHKLEQELAELKEKAIVPKFKIGQEVWFISDPDIEILRKVRHIKVEDISISSFFTERGIMYSGDYRAGLSENELFATKEEAEKKLQELRGGE